MQGGTFSPMCTSDSMDSYMAPGFWKTLISIAEVSKRYCSEIESCKSKPIDQKFQLLCVANRHSPRVVTTERSHDLKFDKGTIYIVYFHTHVHVHIERWVIYQNQSSNCAYLITRCVHVRNLHLGANVHPGANLLHGICTYYKGGANSHPGANLHPGAFS